MDLFNKSYFKWIELLVIFIGLPLLYYFDRIPFHKSIPLLAVFFVFLIILLKDPEYNNRRFLKFMNPFNWRLMLARFFIFAIVTTISVYFFSNEFLFFLPLEKPGLWLLIIISYPVWSAYPQELIYRGYFYHRYGSLIKKRWLLILLNAALFSFSHIIFDNWLAIILTFLGAILFSLTYFKSRSVMVVFIEHTLYGVWIFTVGIGQYFYAPTGG